MKKLDDLIQRLIEEAALRRAEGEAKLAEAERLQQIVERMREIGEDLDLALADSPPVPARVEQMTNVERIVDVINAMGRPLSLPELQHELRHRHGKPMRKTTITTVISREAKRPNRRIERLIHGLYSTPEVERFRNREDVEKIIARVTQNASEARASQPPVRRAPNRKRD